ncbi:MAG TPA: NADP-dependent oxidoreductase [Mycobacterium sp.]
MSMSRQWRLAARPVGKIRKSDFELVEAPVPEPGDGQFVVAVTDISLDPAMRGWMNAGRSYIPPVEIGEVMRALTLGRVIDSRNDQFAVGDLVQGVFGVTEYALSDGAGVQKITPAEGISPSAYLGVLGITGLTAYFGLLDVGRLKAGETVLVSGAAGAVGTVVGQIAKIKGARVIGIAGGAEKCKMLTNELGFDAAVDYKGGDLKDQLHRHTPDRVDVFFDNIGGEILNQGLTRLARGARVVICGAVSQYNNVDVTGPSNYIQLLVSRASMTGFVVFDYADRYPQAIAEMARWLSDGRLRNIEDTVHADIDAFPSTLDRLFTGANTGKLVLELHK